MIIETGIEKISLDSEEEYGKEIFLVIKSFEVRNENIFYTDLNGLFAKKREMKAYELGNYEAYSNNFYPVTSFIYIEDINSKIRMTYTLIFSLFYDYNQKNFRVLNDRTQAMGILNEGEISILIFRRLASLSNEKNSEDLIEKKLKLKHYLMFNDPDYFPNKLRRVQKELERPLIKFSGVSLTNTFQKKK